MDTSGHYESQSSRALQSIVDTRYPTNDKNFTQTISDLKASVKYMAGYMQVMQKGIDQSKEDTFQQLGDIITGITVLLGGGDFTKIDFGDLKYFLPAIGAMFGFDSTTPFPINLFDAAETFFLGYVVPTDAFNETMQTITDNNLAALGFTPKFIQDLDNLNEALQGPGKVITDDLNKFFDSIQKVLNIFGITDDVEDSSQALLNLWTTISKLFGVADPDDVTNIQEFISGVMDEWVTGLTKVTQWVTSILDAWSGDSGWLGGILNFAKWFEGTDFTDPNYDPLESAWEWIRDSSNQLWEMLFHTDIFDPNATLHSGIMPPEWQDVFNDIDNFLKNGNWSELSAFWVDLNQALWGTDNVGTTIKESALPTHWQNMFTDIQDFLINGDWDDLGDAWNELNTALWGSGDVGTTIKTDALPTIPKEKIEGLLEDLDDFVKTFDFQDLIDAWNLAMNIWFGVPLPDDGAAKPHHGMSLQPSMMPTAWQKVVADLQDFFQTGDWGDLTAAWSDLNTALWGSNSIGSIIKTSALPTNWAKVVQDIEDFLATGDWSDVSHAWDDLNTALWGSNTIGTTVKQGAIPSGIPISKVEDLQSKLDDLQQDSKDIWNDFWGLWTGSSGTDKLWSDVTEAWNDIWGIFTGENTSPATSSQQAVATRLQYLNPNSGGYDAEQLTGVDSASSFWNALLSGFGLLPPQDNSTLPQVATVGQTVAQRAQNGQTAHIGMKSKPIYVGVTGTAQTSFAFANASTGWTTLDSPRKVCTIRCDSDLTVGSVSIVLKLRTSTSPDSLYLHVYKLSDDGNTFEHQYTSDNVASQILPAGDWIIVEIPKSGGGEGQPVITDQFPVEPGDVVAIGIECDDYNLVQVHSLGSTMPAHSDMMPQAVAAVSSVVLGDGDISTSSLGSWTNDDAPWVSVDIDKPGTRFRYHAPQRYTFSSETTYTHTLSSWLIDGDLIDLVGVGAGGGGEHTVGISNGYGGDAGKWGTKTLVVGTDIAAGSNISVTPGSHGVGAVLVIDGTDGGDTIFEWTDPSGNSKSFRAYGGNGGGTGSNLTSYGSSPGDITYEGYTYYGGAVQSTDAAGHAPGGGGAGGTAFSSYGKNGAPGEGWIVERTAT